MRPTVPRVDDRRTRWDRRFYDRRTRWDRLLVRHLLMLVLLVGGLLVSRVFAQPVAPSPAVVVSLFDRWLSPDVIIGAALVILYAGELRGDVKRLRADLRAIQQKLHDDYMTRETIEAKLAARR